MTITNILRSMCLKSSYSVRKQLLYSFGSVVITTAFIVMFVGWISLHQAAYIIRVQSETLYEQQIFDKMIQNGKYVSDLFNIYANNIDGAIYLAKEFVEERIVNYPNDGWEDDIYVPFSDMVTGQNKYPLLQSSKRLPYDWEVIRNVNETNVIEHLRKERINSYKSLQQLSTASASYYIQGNCNPNETNPLSIYYLKNCNSIDLSNDILYNSTSYNNNITWDGDTATATTTTIKNSTTPTNKGLSEKSADIGVLLKPLYESHTEILQIGIYYHNSGIGSVLHYPGGHLAYDAPGDDDDDDSTTYVSAGCEWMREINPHSNRSYGTEEEIERCHPMGSLVNHNEYNPNEKLWFQYIVMESTKYPRIWIGPFHNITNEQPIFYVGQGIFDRRTGNFIGCVVVNVAVPALIKFVSDHKIHQFADVAIFNSVNGILLSDSLNYTATTNGRIYDTDFISPEDYRQLIEKLPDLNKPWDSKELDKALINSIIYSEKYFYTVYPLRLDRRDNMVLVAHRIANDIFDKIVEMNEGMDGDIYECFVKTLLIGLAGIVLSFAFVCFVGRRLTFPLLWMERVAGCIVNNKDDRELDHIMMGMTETKPKEEGNCHCFSSTEIAELVSEFQIMIRGFSGPGPSHVAYPDIHEIQNKLTWQSDYQKLYSTEPSENKSTFLQISPNADKNCDASMMSSNIVFENEGQSGMSNPSPIILDSIYPSPDKRFFGSNVLAFSDKKDLQDQLGNAKISLRRSRLFWSILLLMVFPLVLTNITLVFLVTDSATENVKLLLDDVKTYSMELEAETLKSIASIKANQTAVYLNSVIRDMHLITRFAGWLHFGAISRSDAFDRLEQGTQECRAYNTEEDATECPVFDDPDRAPCACEWKDLHQDLTCTEYEIDTRYLQHRHMFGQARDYDPVSGNRDRADTFLNRQGDDKPENTMWWSNLSDMPGAYKGSNASGYATTYDRARVSSAMSVVEIPLYNYAIRGSLPKHFIGSMIAFEADGFGTGYRGCQLSYLNYASFESTESNEAAKVAPYLCPLGKFGYDPRCRKWYASGKNAYMSSGKIPLHITTPYQFAVRDFFAVSVTSPLVKPTTNEYIGQNLLDIMPSIAPVFNRLDIPVSFVISVENTKNDTIIGPDKSVPWISAPIGDLLFKHDDNTSLYQKKFDNDILPILKTQKSVGKGLVSFYRKTESKSVEKLRLAYARVNATGLRPIDPSDFSRGIEVLSFPIYCVGVAYNEDSVNKTWGTIEDNMFTDIDRLAHIYFSVVLFVSIMFIGISYKITIDITRPMITLLKVVQSINARQVICDIPPLLGGSREVHQVYSSFAKLHKIVRVSNTAYFSGDLSWAFEFISDALLLFRKIGDVKAQGIASSNLANTLHAMCHDAVYADDCCRMVPGICCLKSALVYYDRAVEIAENELEEAEGAEHKAKYAQRLSDRLFNRGLFLLLVYNEACAPEDSKPMALQDIMRARDIDNYVTSFLLQHRLLLKNSTDHYCRLLRRSLGLLGFYDDEEVRKVWNAKTLIKDADQFLIAAWAEPSAPLFQDVTREGRLQQLESVAIRYELCKGRFFEAACLSLRMFTEDEYLIDDAFKMAATALSDFSKDDSSDCWKLGTKLLLKSDLRQMLRKRKEIDVDVGKCVVFAIELNQGWEGHPFLDKVNSNCLSMYDDCCFGDDLVGLVAFTTKEDLKLPLGLKSENEGIQRTSLDIATSSTCSGLRPTTPYTIQMIIDSTEPKEIDSFIVLVTDGYSLDPRSLRSLRLQIHRLNEFRETRIHVFIVGVDIDDDLLVEECKTTCTVSKLSLYLGVTTSNIDSAFNTIRKLIRGPQISNTFNKGLTMERF